MIARAIRYFWHKSTYLWRKTSDSILVPTSPDAFSTHLPILMCIATLASPRRILELGSGKFSTPALNDRALFPTAELIHTMEDDAEWAIIVRDLPLDPTRSFLDVVPSIRNRLLEMDLSPYDMIFVDNAVSVSERAATIRAVLGRARADTIVVIHDFEWRAYRAAVPGNWRLYSFKVWKPMTGVIWRGDRLSVQQLSHLDNSLRRYRSVSPARGECWRNIISAA